MTSDCKGEPIVRLAAGNPASGAVNVGQVVLVINGDQVRLELTVPAGPLTVEEVLPVFQGLSDLFADRAVARSVAQGKALSCRAGCGACCRQLVPISEAEAHALAHLVAAMPESRQLHVRQRFKDALETLDAAGMLETLSDPVEGSLHSHGMEYFRAGIACPFLEDEACSIYSDRPLACREYLVTSPARNCEAPSAETIATIELEGKPSLALLKDEAGKRWMPLVFALRFSEHAPAQARDRTGPDILRDVIARLRTEHAR